MTTQAQQWSLQGEYFENCNCRISCPCSMDFSFMPSSPDGSCHVIMAFNVQQGRYGSQDLSGLNVVMVANTPGPQPLGAGGLRAAIYIDERASAQQQEAISSIFSGQAGGLFGMLAPLIGEVLGVKASAIDFGIDGRKRTLRIGDVSRSEGEAVASPVNPEQSVSINGIDFFSPGEAVTQAIAQSSIYNDFGIEWNNTGSNAYMTRLNLTGP